MYLVDANILIYATDRNSVHHERARDWLDERLAGPADTVGLPWPSLLAFVRIVTNPRVYAPPADLLEAWDRVERWLDQPGAWIPQPGPRHRYFMTLLLTIAKPTSQLVPDAHLAALANEHGLIVASADADFARFPDVRWHNPLASSLTQIRPR